MAAGRPKAKINWDTVDKLLQAQCTGSGIASVLGIHYDTLLNACEREKKTNFSEYAQGKRAHGQELLRAKQYELAMKGDRTMLVWLGKQCLGQSERQQQRIEHVGDGAPLIEVCWVSADDE